MIADVENVSFFKVFVGKTLIGWVRPQGGRTKKCYLNSFKMEKNETGTSFSFWDASGDKFVILSPSGPRDLENLNPW